MTLARPAGDCNDHRGLSGAPVPDDDARRRRWWLLGFGALVSIAASGWIVGQHVQSPSQAASNAKPPIPSWITATVEQRVLAETVISRGTVRPQVTLPIGIPTSIEGSPVVTAIGVSVGDDVAEGVRLVEVSGRPVFVLQGEVPVYRSLRPLMTGADVAQLQRALGRLGCDTSADGGVYGEATKICVTRLYADAGYDPVPTSPTDQTELLTAEQFVLDAQAGVDAARLALEAAQRGPSGYEMRLADVGLQGAQRAYNDAVADGDDSVAQAAAALSRAQTALQRLKQSSESTQAEVLAAEGEVFDASMALNAAVRGRDTNLATAADAVAVAGAARDMLDVPVDISAESAALRQAIDTRDQAQRTLEHLRAASGPIIPQGEVVFSPTLPARVQYVVANLGSVGAEVRYSDSASTAGPSGELATLSAGELVVSTILRPTAAALVRVGMGVDLLDEQSNITYPATVSTISEIAVTTTDGETGFLALLAPEVPLPDHLSGANLRVTVTAAATEGVTLVVPIAAVSSAADGTTNISVIPRGAGRDALPVTVAVSTGLSADGFVAIKSAVPGALREGDQVIVG